MNTLTISRWFSPAMQVQAQAKYAEIVLYRATAYVVSAYHGLFASASES